MTCNPLNGTRRLLLQWHITERCNLRCAHCYQDNKSVEELDLDSCLAVLNQFETLLGKLKTGANPRGHITITGGEPFIRHDFLDLLRIIARRKNQYGFAVLTNGTLIDEPLADELARLGPTYVQISIEGTQETHNRIRGAGNFEKATHGVRSLTNRGVRTLLSFTAHRGNYQEFPSVVRLGRKLGVARVWSDRLIPCGSGADLDESLLTPIETQAFFELMAQTRSGWLRRKLSRTEVAMHRALQFLVGHGQPYQCSAGRSLITLLPNGDLLPCRRLPISVGNVMATELSELFFESDLFKELRDERVAVGCETCFYKKLCGGGLRCLAHAVTGDWRKADPGCWLADKTQSDITPTEKKIEGSERRCNAWADTG